MGQQLCEQGQHASSAPGGGLREGPARLPAFSFSFAPLHSDAHQAQRAVRHERLPPLLILPGSEVRMETLKSLLVMHGTPPSHWHHAWLLWCAVLHLRLNAWWDDLLLNVE